MKQAKTVSASVRIGLASEGQGPESRVDFGPLVIRLECNLLSEASVISQPPVAFLQQLKHTLRRPAATHKH